MARWPRFRCAIIEDLHRQLAWSGDQARHRMLEEAMVLVREVDDDRAYPVDFVIWRLTRWRPEANDSMEGLPGDALRADLITLVQRVSHRIPGDGLQGDVLSLDDVAQSLGISRRSVERLRGEGLLMTYWKGDDGQRRLGCLRDDLDWFIEQSQYQRPAVRSAPPVERIQAMAMAHGVTDSREDAARAIVMRDPTLNIATIRGVLRRLERSGSIYTSAQSRLTLRQQEVGMRAWWRGMPVKAMADRFEIGRPSMHRALLRMRASVLSDMAVAWSMDGDAKSHSDIDTVPWDVQATFSDDFAADQLQRAMNTYRQSVCWFVDQATSLIGQPAASDVDDVEVSMRVAVRWRWTATICMMPLLTRVVAMWASRAPEELPPSVRRKALVSGTRLLNEQMPHWCGLTKERLESRVIQALGSMISRLPALRHDLAHSRIANDDGVLLRSLLPPTALVPDPRWELAINKLDDTARSLVASRWGLAGHPSRTLEQVAAVYNTTPQGMARRWASAQRQLIVCSRLSR